MLTIAVCDDNPQFAHQLTARLRELCAHILPERVECRITAAFSSGEEVLRYLRQSSGEEVLRYLRQSSIHILFLDIDMPGMGGFELASDLRSRAPDTVIIFVSAYDDFVYSSFEYAPFRFLRKSHLEEELPVTLQKVVEKCMMDSETVTVHTLDGELTLRVRDILYLEGEGNYYTVRTSDGEAFRCRSTLSAAEELVAGYDFFRIHQGYLVNLEHIRAVGDDGALRMDNGATLYVSRRKLTAFREAYMQFTRRRLTR